MTRQDPVEKIIYLGCVVLLAAAALNPGAESLWGINLLVIGIFFLFGAFAINRVARAKPAASNGLTPLSRCRCCSFLPTSPCN
jgi:hypothetical protein